MYPMILSVPFSQRTDFNTPFSSHKLTLPNARGIKAECGLFTEVVLLYSLISSLKRVQCALILL